MDYNDAMNVCYEAMRGHKRANASQLDIFFNFYPNKNICTANIAGYLSLEKDKYIAEISFGSGIYSGTYILV
jgi:hypothetical protein